LFKQVNPAVIQAMLLQLPILLRFSPRRTLLCLRAECNRDYRQPRSGCDYKSRHDFNPTYLKAVDDQTQFPQISSPSFRYCSALGTFRDRNQGAEADGGYGWSAISG
jgi:hypothetical protein